LNKLILAALRRLRRGLDRQGRKGPRRQRGRPRRGQKRRRAKQGRSLKEKSTYIFKHRHLIVQRREHMSEHEKKNLTTLLAYLPALISLRQFADKLHRLFDVDQSAHQAWCRWRGLRQSAAFLAIPELNQALLVNLEEAKFAKMIAFLRGPARRRRMMRTNNHVERCNRKLRYWEKVRYKWRRRRTLVRFIVLALDRWWKEAFATPLPEKRSSGGNAKKRPPAKKQKPAATS
jgi:hypothetical protein